MKSRNALFAAALALLTFGIPSMAQEVITVPRADGAETALSIYTPAETDCAPLAVISPGAGGTEKGYSYLAEGLREHGWLAVVVGHKESGPTELRDDMRQFGLHGGIMAMVTDPALYRARLMDIGAALSWAKSCKRPYKVLLGHSMGSSTVMIEAGAHNKLGVKGKNRFDAYVAMSPSGVGSIFPEHAWEGIHKPLYVLTGTRDKGLEGPWEWRASPYEDLRSRCKWLGVVDDATHMNFAGAGFAGKTKKLTLDTVDAFLEDARKGNCAPPTAEPGMRLEGK